MQAHGTIFNMVYYDSFIIHYALQLGEIYLLYNPNWPANHSKMFSSLHCHWIINEFLCWSSLTWFSFVVVVVVEISSVVYNFFQILTQQLNETTWWTQNMFNAFLSLYIFTCGIKLLYIKLKIEEMTFVCFKQRF